jgi:hypothetical protein
MIRAANSTRQSEENIFLRRPNFLNIAHGKEANQTREKGALDQSDKLVPTGWET